MADKLKEHHIKRLEDAQKFVEELRFRKLIAYTTREDSLISLLAEGKRTYMGIDPTSDSLHLGHYVGLSLLKRFIENKYPVIILIGTFTAQVGDPSFRRTARQFNPNIFNNGKTLRQKLEKFFFKYINRKDEYGTPLLEIVDNYDFHEKRFLTDVNADKKPLKTVLSLVEEVFSFMKISELFAQDFIQDRIHEGLTLSECLYPGLQGWDFFHLHKDKNVAIQIGGQDQLCNMLWGIELIRKNLIKEQHLSINEDNFSVNITKAVAFIFPLLLDSRGAKFGKTLGNSILILEKDGRQVYEVWQYLRNIDDKSIEDYFLKLTSLSHHEIQELMKNKMEAKVRLADEVCSDIFGSEHAEISRDVSEKIHSGLMTALNYEGLLDMSKFFPSYEFEWREDLQISSLFEFVGLVSSKSEFNRLVSEKGISVSKATFDDLKANQFKLKDDWIFWKNKKDKKAGIVVLKRGKKHYALVHLSKRESVFKE